MINKLLIANRGEIARRIMRTARSMGFGTVAVYSEADRDAPFVAEADEAVCIGPAPSSESYLVVDAILEAARRTGADAIHPGYGFLAENPVFAEACQAAGLVFVGPGPESIRAMGSKIAAKALMRAHNVPVVPGYDGADQSVETLAAEAGKIGLPVLLKASAGGGGKGVRVVYDAAELPAAIEAARREALSAFGDDTLLIEKYLERPRHIEFQIFGDADGNVLHLFERECSIQRRHQKIIEEAPSVLLERRPELRKKMAAAAVAAGAALAYRSAGTVEFIVDEAGEFYFLEVNTRLQVEHPVTEETTGIDLVRWQLLVAGGEPLPMTQDDITREGVSIECRLYAEDPANGFLPSVGTLHDWHVPTGPGVRVDSGVEPHSEVGIHYDPMLAKVITVAPSRSEATRLMIRTLESASIQGVRTNRSYLARILRTDDWRQGHLDTHFVDRHADLQETTFNREGVTEPAALVATAVGVMHRSSAQTLLPDVAPGYRNNRWRWSDQVWRHGGDDVQVNYVVTGANTLQMAVTPPFVDGRWAEGRSFEPDQVCEVAVLSAETRGDLTVARVSIDGHIASWRVVLAQAHVYVHGANGSVTLEEVDRLAAKAVDAAEGGYAAPMPGKVLRVLVSAGQAVSAGEALMVLEAMKMESTLAAHEDGTVGEVFVEEGQQVEADQLLLSMLEAEEE